MVLKLANYISSWYKQRKNHYSITFYGSCKDFQEVILSQSVLKEISYVHWGLSKVSYWHKLPLIITSRLMIIINGRADEKTGMGDGGAKPYCYAYTTQYAEGGMANRWLLNAFCLHCLCHFGRNSYSFDTNRPSLIIFVFSVYPNQISLWTNLLWYMYIHT